MSAADVSPRAELTPAEVDQLAADEAIIEAGQAIFMKVGMALARIRDARLYRATHDTFADYVDQRWGFTRIRAYQLIEAGVVAASVSTMVDTPEIENERQARALAPIVKESGPEAGAEVLREVAESDEKVTAKAIKAKVEAKAKKPKPKGFHKNPLLEQIEAGVEADPITIIPAPESEPIKVKTHVEPAPEPESIKVRVHLESGHDDSGAPTAEAIAAMSLREVVDLDRALQDRADSKLRSLSMIEALEATQDRLHPLWVVIDTVKELPGLADDDLAEIADLAEWRPTADEITKAIDALTRLRGMVAGRTV